VQVKNAVFVFCSDQYYLHFWEVSVSRDLTVDDFIIMLAYMGMELPNNVARLVAFACRILFPSSPGACSLTKRLATVDSSSTYRTCSFCQTNFVLVIILVDLSNDLIGEPFLSVLWVSVNIKWFYFHLRKETQGKLPSHRTSSLLMESVKVWLIT